MNCKGRAKRYATVHKLGIDVALHTNEINFLVSRSAKRKRPTHRDGRLRLPAHPFISLYGANFAVQQACDLMFPEVFSNCANCSAECP